MDMNWFNEAKFGMFVHWGLYAQPGGGWRGCETPSISEWLMHKFRIPAREYAALAGDFNPVDFDADRWVETAQAAGMRYMVVTSKHHEGFAMFHSKCTDYNIVDATPFGRDPLKELSVACEKRGMKLGFYYSQDQDWHHPGGSGNYWDYPNRTDADFAAYLESKVKPQLAELLAGYGKVAVIWFDTPMTLSESQSLMLKEYVHSLQPDCLVSGRVGHGLGDYQCLRDNETPDRELSGLWEGLGTMNNSWGFKPSDQDRKSVQELVEILIRTSACGANYLLNVGPDARGVIPEINAQYLAEMGAWLAVNGDAVYGSGRSPLRNVSKFDRHLHLTAKPGKVYAFVTQEPEGAVRVCGIRNAARSARVLSAPERSVRISQVHNSDHDHHQYDLELPNGLDFSLPQVVEIELDGEPDARWDAYTAGFFSDSRWKPPRNKRPPAD